MSYERLKKGLVSLIITATIILSAGFAGSSIASAQRYDRDDHRWDHRDRAEMWRIRRLDREHRIRFRMNSSRRVAGYYDRFGNFHAYGYYDAFGRFHRY